MKWMGFFFMLATGCAGCIDYVPGYDPLGQHTLRVAADQEADVVWLQRVDPVTKKVRLLRCHLAPEGPTCVEAKVP